jgi:NarL family two-component system response regulator LiaR
MTEGQRIRVVVVDDHAVVRSGIEFSLMALGDIELVGSAASGEEALRLCKEMDPDVVLMDMMMPDMDGSETTRALLEFCPNARVIALTSFQEGKVVQDALQAGATSYLLKDVGMDELADVIRSTHAGRGTLAPEATQALTEAATRARGLGQDLSLREREVLRLIVHGKSNVEIADLLSISLSTARFHVSTILSKLGAANRAEAAALAVKLDLV